MKCAEERHPFQFTVNPGWMHETSDRGWCAGKTQRNGMRREVGGRDGEHM